MEKEDTNSEVRTEKIKNDYTSFYNDIINKIDDNEQSVVTNPDGGHNSLVYSAMFEKSQVVNMVCGKMSALRTSLYHQLEKEYVDSGISDDDAKSITGFLVGRLNESLESFLDREGSELNIFVVDFDKTQLKDFCCKEAIENGVRNKKINIYPVPKTYFGRDMLIHVTMGDKRIVRMEMNKEKRSAQVIIYPEESTVNSLARSYASLQRTCEKFRIESV